MNTFVAPVVTVLQHSPDGIIANIDFEVRELSGTDNRIHFSDNVVPLIRVNTIIVDNTDEDLPAENKIGLYPNPATDITQVNLEFAKAFSDVTLRLLDNQGSMVYTQIISQSITRHIERIDVSQLIPGRYLLQVETVDGQRSVPLIIVR